MTDGLMMDELRYEEDGEIFDVMDMWAQICNGEYVKDTWQPSVLIM